MILLVGGYHLYQHLKRQSPPLRRKLMMRYMLYGVIGLLVILAITGRMHWVGAAIAILIPVAKAALSWGLKLFPFYRQWLQNRERVSIINTSIICVTINQANGFMDGDVIDGPFSNKQLSSLNQKELDQLKEYCENKDPEAVQLLSHYQQWRFKSHKEQSSSQQQDQSSAFNSQMKREEALQILGLEDGASEEEIINAHRRLMQKLHPDRGGSDYLAAKINQAKDILT